MYQKHRSHWSLVQIVRMFRIEVIGITVSWLGADEEIVEITVQVFERWSLLGVSLPSGQHDLIDRIGTLHILGLRHSITSFHLLEHVTIAHP